MKLPIGHGRKDDKIKKENIMKLSLMAIKRLLTGTLYLYLMLFSLNASALYEEAQTGRRADF